MLRMILSLGRNYVFIHIPKTGGTSLALALEARAMADDIMLGDTPKALRRRRRVKDAVTRGRLWKHSRLEDIEGLVPQEQLENLFAFTLVRNPWDRVVSLYHWLRVQTFRHPSISLAQTLSFCDFVQNEAMIRAFENSPATSYMKTSDGRLQCSAFIRLEHFEEDAQPLFSHLGFELELSRVNTSQRLEDYRSYYTDAAAETIAQCCAADIDRFGYVFST